MGRFNKRDNARYSNLKLVKVVSRFKGLLLPVAVTASLITLFTFLLGLRSPAYIDLLFCLLITVPLYAFSKRNVMFVVNAAQVVALFYLFGAMKLQYFGEPATPADIVSLVALFGLQSDATQWAVKLLLLVLLSLLLFNLQYSKRLFLSVAAAATVLYSVVVLGVEHNAISPYVKTLSESDSVILRQYSATVHFYEEWLKSPDFSGVDLARQKIKLPIDASSVLAGVQKRDVYLIVIESLWDPTVLGGIVRHDPIYKQYRQLWNASANVHVLGPSFGGGTPNPEFEILCGAPLNSGFIVFEHPLLANNLSCLPNILGNYGYYSVASHPNLRDFWNRDYAYPALGFDLYHAIDDFVLDEMVGFNYLSDASLYRQHTEKTRGRKGALFHYVLTASAHYPYMDNANMITVASGEDEPRRLLDSYVGLIERGTKDVYEYIRAIQGGDKDALIVVLGDHPPLFGKDFAMYREAGLVTHKKKNMDVEELMQIYSTPLVVIDGVNGPINPTIKSMYEIPVMIIELLKCYDGRCANAIENDVIHYRPVSGQGVLYFMDEQWRLCKNSDTTPDCTAPLDWLAAAQTLRNATIVGYLAAGSIPH